MSGGTLAKFHLGALGLDRVRERLFYLRRLLRVYFWFVVRGGQERNELMLSFSLLAAGNHNRRAKWRLLQLT